MRRHHLLSALLAATLAVTIWSWNRPIPITSTYRPLKIVPGESVTYQGRTYSPVVLRMVDSITGKPVSGADVHVMCLGGTPFGTQTNRTSARGTVEVLTYQNTTFVPLDINAPGFRPIKMAAFTSNSVVKLSLLPL